MRVYFLYSKFPSGENLHGAATGIKDFIFGDKKNQNLKTHVTIKKKLGGRKGQLFQELWVFISSSNIN